MAKRESQTVTKRQLDLYYSDLIPREIIDAVTEVLNAGAKKYGRDNWRTYPYLTRNEIVKSLFRHQQAIAEGELQDTGEGGTGLLHSAHVAVNAIFQLYYDLSGYFPETDPVGGFRVGDKVELTEAYGDYDKGSVWTITHVYNQFKAERLVSLTNTFYEYTTVYTRRLRKL